MFLELAEINYVNKTRLHVLELAEINYVNKTR